MELRGWLDERGKVLARRWHAEIQTREDRRGEEGDGILKAFLEHLVAFLPPCFGERREEGEEIWEQSTRLYGSMALLRGLSAGEVVEELQLLRAEILKLLLPEMVCEGMDEASRIRELLDLNQLLDKGVVSASVAYLDDLFFAHLQGSGIPGDLTPEMESEIRSQLEAFAVELDCGAVSGEDCP